MLLIADARDFNGVTKLDCWAVGGQHLVIAPPVQPYFYSHLRLSGSKPVIRYKLSDVDEPVRVYLREFKSVFDVMRYRNESTFEDNVPFIQRVAIDVGFDIPSGQPSVMSWDCESFSEGLAPDPLHDRLRSIAVWGEGFKDCFTGSPAEILAAFFKCVRERDPDILAGFNDGFYDWPLVLAECARHRIQPRIGRDRSIPYIQTREWERKDRRWTEATVLLGGRICFDVWHEVNNDQSLFDMKDADTGEVLKTRGLNDVSRHFGLRPITDVDHAAIPEDRLCETNIDDARCTYALAQLYLRNLTYLADYLKIPLSMMIHRAPSHIGNYLLGREYYAMGIVSDASNEDRFPEIFSVGRGGKAYQGAYVDCELTGLFRNVTHFDFTSFYPSIMIAFNLSPETVKLVKVSDYTGDYKFIKEGDYAIIEVPDRVVNAKGEVVWQRQVVCRIDMKREGVVPKKMKQVFRDRVKVKREYEATDDPELKSQLFSESNGLKVVLNCLYGLSGMKFSRYGNILCSLLTTALGRYIIKYAINEKKKEGFSMIETDSDGFWTVKK